MPIIRNSTRYLLLVITCLPTVAQSYALHVSRQDFRVLSSVVYFEARGEPLKCQKAVVDVVLNRAKQQKKSVVEIVSAPSQFSFVRGGKIPSAPSRWLVINTELIMKWTGIHYVDTTNGATFFFRRDVKTPLKKRLILVYTCSNHNFYRRS